MLVPSLVTSTCFLKFPSAFSPHCVYSAFSGTQTISNTAVRTGLAHGTLDWDCVQEELKKPRSQSKGGVPF